MSLIPGYPHLGGRDARCELDRVTWRIPELDSGVAPDPSCTRPKYRLERGKGTITLYELRKDAFLTQLVRLFHQEPEKLSPNGIVAFATAQAFTQAHTRQRAEDRAVQADSELRQKDTPFVLATPEAIRAAQASFCPPQRWRLTCGAHWRVLKNNTGSPPVPLQCTMVNGSRFPQRCGSTKKFWTDIVLQPSRS